MTNVVLSANAYITEIDTLLQLSFHKHSVGTYTENFYLMVSLPDLVHQPAREAGRNEAERGRPGSAKLAQGQHHEHLTRGAAPAA